MHRAPDPLVLTLDLTDDQIILKLLEDKPRVLQPKQQSDEPMDESSTDKDASGRKVCFEKFKN